MAELVNLDVCRVCGKAIRIMVRRHTGLCSENCEQKEKRKWPSTS